MRIGIEAQRIFRSNKHGMDYVALETIRELQAIDTENQYFIFVKPGEDRCLSETANFKIMELNCPSYPLWEQFMLPYTVAKLHLDLLHCTSNTAPIYSKTPLILTLHDIIFLEKRPAGNKSLYQNMGWYYRKLIVPRILEKCKKIITVSHFECERIKSTLKLPEEQVIAIYNGYNEHFKPQKTVEPVCNKYISSQPFLFFLGNTDPKKNVPRTLKAYSLYLERSANPLPLLIADIQEKTLNEILKSEKIESIRKYIHCPGYIDNKDLAYIYSGAHAFLYTSLRESFGIPILEAMACGTPVITGNVSAMPEIAGEGGILVDPTNTEAIAKSILRLESDPTYYQEQVAYGLKRVKDFSWKQTAIKLLNIYKSYQKK